MKTANKPRRAKGQTGGRGSATARPAAADWRWADPKSLKVDPALQRLIPLQSRGEYLALQQSIQAEGCLDPLLVWKERGVLLDGHTRRDLCIEHKKPVKVREVALPDERAAVEYVLGIQRQRRNLSREAMSYFRGAEYNAVKRRRGGRRSAWEIMGGVAPPPSTALRLARKYGVSEKTIKRDALYARAVDRIVVEHGGADVQRRLLGADVRLTQGTAAALLRLPAAERKAAVDQLIELGELPRKAGEPPASRPRDVAQSLLARLQAKGEGHARSVVVRMARLLGLEIAEKASDP